MTWSTLAGQALRWAGTLDIRWALDQEKPRGNSRFLDSIEKVDWTATRSPTACSAKKAGGYRAAFAGNVSLAPFSYNYSTVIAPLNDVQGEMGERHAAAGHDGLTPLGPRLECS